MGNLKVGLEVHVQLVSLKTKLFCGCSADYRGKPPNTNICPVCTGMPGAMPSLNKKAVEEALKVALILNAKPYPVSYFFRKSYFYPDLPKNFQITQYDKAGGYPLAHDGFLEINGKTVRIERIHMEEDPGRIYYEGSRATARYSLVDYNRSGIALVEIVTAPDMESGKDAREFLEELMQRLEDVGINVREYEGSIRCDVNVSYGGGERVEVKNVSGASEVEKVVGYEELRQKSLFERGIRVVRETRMWDERRRITLTSRSKELEEEYRYMPEPDLPPLVISDELISKARSEIAGSFNERLSALIGDGINESVARRIATDIRLYRAYMELKGAASGHLPELANLLANEVSYVIKREGLESLPANLSPLAELAKNYQAIQDKRAAVEYIQSWLKGRPLPKVVGPRPGIDADAAVDEVLKTYFDKVKGLDERRRVDFLMGVLISKYGAENKKELARALLKKLNSISG